MLIYISEARVSCYPTDLGCQKLILFVQKFVFLICNLWQPLYNFIIKYHSAGHCLPSHLYSLNSGIADNSSSHLDRNKCDRFTKFHCLYIYRYK